MPVRSTSLRAAAFLALLLLLPAVPVGAAVLPGDLNGDGSVNGADEALFRGAYSSVAGDSRYQAAADFDADGKIGVADLGVFGAGFDATGGDVDVTPPTLLVTLNDIPDDQNDLLVVPPEGFQITIHFDGGAHSLADPSTLSVTSSEPIGWIPAGAQLGPHFTVTPNRAVLEIPAGADLGRTAHFLTVSVRDLAGNEAGQVYGFAVRDFEIAAPLGNLNRIFLDFDQDRSPSPNGIPDFLEDLREYGLASAAEPALEAVMRNLLVAEIVARVNAYYGRNEDGSPGPDAVNVLFSAAAPIDPHARLCIGGSSPAGPLFLGSTQTDVNNLDEFGDECILAGSGVFPQAMDDLWGGNALFQQTFTPVDPGLGGTAYGDFPPDVTGYDFSNPTHAQRFLDVIVAANAFAQAVATATAHEVGHMLGLTAPGPAPAGLFGGQSGFEADHNVTPTGGTPTGNFLMNQGATFTFDEMTGQNGEPLPVFRPLNWAYLRDRVALNGSVTGLFPGPVLTAIVPNPANYGGGSSQPIAFEGQNFVAPVTIELYLQGSQIPKLVSNLVVVDPETITGLLWSFLVPPGTYDVRLLNGDDQELWWSQQLVVGP